MGKREYSYRGKSKGSDLVFCSCRSCKRGMRNEHFSMVRHARRRYRRMVHMALHTWRFDRIPSRFPVGYRD